MRYSKDLIGKSVVSVDEGRHIGTVRDVYLDQSLEWLAGVHLGKEGLISRRSLLIPREAITVFGVDVVLARSADVVTDDKKLPASETWLRLDKLQGREVDTTGGTKVGVIGDAILDEEARIIAFSLSRVYVEGPVAESRTIYQAAIVDNGQQDGTMTVDLTVVERQSQAEEPTAVQAPEKPLDVSLEPETLDVQEEE
ncbi:MAG TPA: PRC-barrel domain-containing protein [Candidatus Binatia bacterium]|jgi:uncharacterized protein YrrD|nr:PRC-barrel domain-containing protein [Candidatus Binatia bacterium]